MHSIKNVKQKISDVASSSRGRNILTFLIFLLISTVFWFIMQLNDEVQHEFEVPFKIKNIPEDVTFLSDVPSKLSVNVKDKGISLIRWNWGNIPELEVGYPQFQNNGRTLFMNTTQLTGMVRSLFGGVANIVEVKPDSISLVYTTNAPVKKAINLIADISTSPQYTVSGPVTVSIDSVKAYSATGIPKDLKIVTDTVSLSALTDTTFINVRLRAPNGIKLVPDVVKVMVPVEPIIAKKKNIPVEVKNVPDSLRILTFPSSVDISYTVPLSAYNHDDFKPRAVAFYNNDSRKLPLTLVQIPSIYSNVTLLADSVEFLVERK